MYSFRKFIFFFTVLLLLASCSQPGDTDKNTDTPIYKITFNKNSGDVSGDMTPQEVKSGSTVSLKSCEFTKVGASFVGWATTADGTVDYTDGADYLMGNKDVTLYAKWLNNYTVTFDKNDSSATGTMTPLTISEGGTKALTKCSFVKDGWAFIGWATTTNGDVTYSDEASYTIASANVTLYAKWGELFTIKFNKNDEDALGGMDDVQVVSGKSINLPKMNFTKFGWHFTGWSIDPTGDIEYSDEEQFTMSTSDVTLDANWAWNDYNLRDIGPTGGLIFYINPDASTDGWKYMEAAESDLTEKKVWGKKDAITPGFFGFEIGDGKDNTMNILGDESADISAGFACYHYSVEVDQYQISGWFLPSRDELHEMYTVLKDQGVGDFTIGSYWSSSQDTTDDTQAYRENFFDGTYSTSPKDNLEFVRPVHRF